MDDISIDQNKLPGVKEVCRDFAVLEDHCLAHNLQEQEIESHLASNIHKNRLVQQDLRVAKRLQEEEDQRAKVQNQKQQKDIERIDNEMAQEIQEQLVWQAVQQRQQEEKDEAIARKLQEREMKEERKRQKQQEVKLEEQYYDERGAFRPSSDPLVQYPGTDLPECGRESYRDINRSRSPAPGYTKLDQKRHLDSQGNHNRHVDVYSEEIGSFSVPEHCKTGNKGRSDDKCRWPGNHTSETRTKYLKKYTTEGNARVSKENCQGRKYHNLSDVPRHYQELLMPTKERPYWSDSVDRDKERERRRDRYEKKDRTKERKNRDKAQCGDRDYGQDDSLSRDISRESHWLKEVDQDTGENTYRSKIRDFDMEKDRHGRKERERECRKHHSRDRSRGKDLDDPTLPATIKQGSEEGEENTIHSSKQRLHIGSDEVFEEPSLRSDSKCQNPQDRGRNIQGQYGIRDAVQGLAQMDLRSQEMRDIEVARRLQDEEAKASRTDKRAVQVAQDEEIARRLMEEEEREYRRSREKEKQAMERQQRRADGDFKLIKEDVNRPRTREEYDYQRPRNPKPIRPPARTHNYENVDSSYGYSDNYSPGPLSRPDTAYKGAYYRQ